MPKKITLSAKKGLIIVMTTMTGAGRVEKLASGLLRKKLAACISFMPVTSRYLWKGRSHRDNEILLLIKTVKTKLKALRTFLEKNHPYDLPEFVVLEGRASRQYEAWVRNPS